MARAEFTVRAPVRACACSERPGSMADTSSTASNRPSTPKIGAPATGLPAAIPLKELNAVPSRASPRARSSIPPSGDRRGGETVVFLQGRRKTEGAWVSRMAQGPGTGVSQMMPSSLDGVYPDGSCQVLWEDGERVFCRGWRLGDDGNRNVVLVVLPAAEHPSPSSLD